MVMLSDILPTGFECCVLNGKIQPGNINTVSIVGTGFVGLAALLTAQFYSPAAIIMIDFDDNHLYVAKRFGAIETINNADDKAVKKLMQMGVVLIPQLKQLVYLPLSISVKTLWRQAGPSPILVYTELK
jgi:threonine dehydrogenase-like Zn-dependent dehydrogenase